MSVVYHYIYEVITSRGTSGWIYLLWELTGLLSYSKKLLGSAIKTVVHEIMALYMRACRCKSWHMWGYEQELLDEISKAQLAAWWENLNQMPASFKVLLLSVILMMSCFNRDSVLSNLIVSNTSERALFLSLSFHYRTAPSIEFSLWATFLFE